MKAIPTNPMTSVTRAESHLPRVITLAASPMAKTGPKNPKPK